MVQRISSYIDDDFQNWKKAQEELLQTPSENGMGKLRTIEGAKVPEPSIPGSEQFSIEPPSLPTQPVLDESTWREVGSIDYNAPSAPKVSALQQAQEMTQNNPFLRALQLFSQDNLASNLANKIIPDPLRVTPTSDFDREVQGAGSFATEAALFGGIGETVLKGVAPIVKGGLKKAVDLAKGLPTWGKVAGGIGGTAAAVDTGIGAFTPNDQAVDRDFLQTTGASLRSGVGDVLTTAGGVAEWQGWDELGESLGATGESIKTGYEQKPEEFSWRSFFNPNFYATNVARSVPLTLSLVPAMYGGYKLGGTAGAKLGLSPFKKAILASVTGAGVSRPLEAAMEAGSTYQDMIARGADPDKAEEAANSVFKKNLSMVGLDALQLAAAFAPVQLKAASKLGKIALGAGRIGAAAGMEAGEEGLQEVFQRQATGEQIAFDPQMKEAMAIGGIFGGAMGGVGAVSEALGSDTTQSFVTDTMETAAEEQPPELIDNAMEHIKERTLANLPDAMLGEVNGTIEREMADGTSREEAIEKALDNVADTEEGKQIIDEVVQAVVEEVNSGRIKIMPRGEYTDAYGTMSDKRLMRTQEEGVSGPDIVYDSKGRKWEVLDDTSDPSRLKVRSESGAETWLGRKAVRTAPPIQGKAPSTMPVETRKETPEGLPSQANEIIAENGAGQAKPAVVGQEAITKEPWQMNKEEFARERPHVEGYRYHGSPEGDLTSIDPYYHTQNWREGIGFYTTNSRDAAKMYAEGRTAKGERKGIKGAINYIEGKPNTVLDMDAPVDKDFWKGIVNNATGENEDKYFEQWLDDAKTNMDAYREAVEYLREELSSDAQYAVEEGLESKGITATAHMEGVKGGKPHQVFIHKTAEGQRVVPPDEVHRKAVKQAIKEGKPVPQEVLAEYPDLQSTTQAQQAEKQPPKPESGQVAQKGATGAKEEKRSYQDVQDEIDAYEEELIEKYGQDEVLKAPVIDVGNLAASSNPRMTYEGKETKLTDEELGKLKELYGFRDSIGEAEDTAIIDAAMSRMPKEGPATPEMVRSTVAKLLKDTTFYNAMGYTDSDDIQDVVRKIYVSLSHKLVAEGKLPDDFAGDFELALEVARDFRSSIYGTSPAPLLRQIKGIVRALFGDVESQNVELNKLLPESKEPEQAKKQTQPEVKQQSTSTLADYGLSIKKITTKSGNTGWEMTGDTAKYKDILRQLGAREKDGSYIFYASNDPTGKILAKLPKVEKPVKEPEVKQEQLTKEKIANDINAVKDLGRTIVTNYELDFVEGEIYDNRGKIESWTDRNNSVQEFIPETPGSIKYVLQCDKVPCHAVDYSNPVETDILGATGAEKEAECLVVPDTKMRITSVSTEDDYQEMGYYLVELEIASEGKTDQLAKSLEKVPIPENIQTTAKEPASQKPFVTGKTVTAKTERGTSVEVQYAVIPADELIASHKTDLSKNKAYPEELQPRQRERAASEEQISRIAANMEPEFLGESPKVSEGAPIVGSDMVVESGNGRVIALQRVYQGNKGNADKYRQWLLSNAEKFGLNPDKIESIESPVLVRIRQTDVDRVKFTQEANEQTVASMSAAEQATVDAKKLTGGILAMFVPSETGEIRARANHDFITNFMQHVVGPSERGKYVTSDGSLSQDGATRIKNAIFAKAYGDIATIEKLAESTDNNVKNITNAMLIAAPKIAKVKEGIDSGSLYQLDITPDIAAAMKKLSQLRDAGESVGKYLNQTNLFGAEISDLAKDLLEVFDNNKRHTKKIAALLNNYVDAVTAVGDPRQESMFSSTKPTKAEALLTALRKVEREYEAPDQAALFQDQAVRGKADRKEATGTAKAGKDEVNKPGVQGMARRPASPPPGKGSTTETIRRKDIVKFLEAHFAPIRTGRFRGKSLGIFKIKPEVIRSRLAHDLPVICHEVGHYLDKKLGLANPVHDQELLNLGQPQSKKGYTQAQIRAEGVAEFMRLYLTDPQQAGQEAPQYYAAFENVIDVHPEIKDALQTTQRDIELWYSQPAEARVAGAISVGDKGNTRKMSLTRLYSLTIDEIHPLKKFVEQVGTKGLPLEKDPYKLAWLARGWSGKAETLLHRGVLDENGHKIGKSLDEILKPVKDELDAFRNYAVAKHSLEVTAQGKHTGILDADAQEVVDKAPTRYQDALEDLVKYQDALLDKLIDSGVMEASAKAKMREMYPNYIPFYRVFDEDLNTITAYMSKGGFANLRNPVKMMKGSARDIVDPLESIIKNTYIFTNIAERNNVGKSIVELAESKEGTGQFVEKVDAQFNVAKENILTIYRNGKAEKFQLDPDLYRATLFLDRESANLLVKILSYPASWLRAGATLSPDFMVRNPLRDQFSAFINSKYGYVPGYDLIKGIFHAFKKDDMYWQFQNSGAAHASMVALDRDYLQKDIKKFLGKSTKEKVKTVVSPHTYVELLRALSELGEYGTRLGEFSKGVKKGASPLEAALSSRDLTLDFARVGTHMKQFNRIIAFMNAAVQGGDKMVRQFRDKPAQTILKVALSITLPSVLLWFANHDDDRYKELPQWEKDTFWIILTKNHIFRIPKPFELGILFGTVPERVLSWVYENDPKAFKELGKTIGDAFLPGYIPTALLPIIETWANKSFFTNRTIVPEREKKLEPKYQFGPYTTETSKAIGDVMNWSPRKIENFIRGYTGGLGMYTIKLGEGIGEVTGLMGAKNKPSLQTSQYPVLKAFMAEPYASSQSVQDFYDELNDLESKYSTTKQTKQPHITQWEYDRLKAMRKVADKFSDIRKLEREIESSSKLTPDQKKEALERSKMLMVNMAKAAEGKKPVK